MSSQALPVRPRVFVGSSTESLDAARALQVLLDHECEVTVWTNGVFGPGGTLLTSLLDAVRGSDFAVMIVTADDTATVRGHSRNVARDNVVFELGLFIGGLGAERCFMLFDRTQPPDLPSDLLGAIPATYQPHESGNLEGALGAASTKILQSIRRHGPRKDYLAQRLGEATDSLESSGASLDRLVRLLARSRAVELDIISAQFGPLIGSKQLSELQRDLAELMDALDEQDE